MITASFCVLGSVYPTAMFTEMLVLVAENLFPELSVPSAAVGARRAGELLAVTFVDSAAVTVASGVRRLPNIRDCVSRCSAWRISRRPATRTRRQQCLGCVSNRLLGGFSPSPSACGGMVAYALARLQPEAVRGVMILDVPIPGLEPWERVKVDPVLWHFGFHPTSNAPERLITGREAIYFREVFFSRFARNPETTSRRGPAPLRRLLRLAGPARCRPRGLSRVSIERTVQRRPARPNRRADRVGGGEHSLAPLNAIVAESLRAHGWRNVSVEVIANSGHQVIDEQGAAVADLLERYAAR